MPKKSKKGIVKKKKKTLKTKTPKLSYFLITGGKKSTQNVKKKANMYTIGDLR